MAQKELTEEQIQEYKEVFDLFDKDGDGVICQNELGKVIRTLWQNPSEADIKKLMDKTDKDGSGRIEFDEFLEVMKDQIEKNPNPEQEVLNAFKMFDRNGDGHISRSELRYLLTQIGERLTDAEFEEMMQDADVDQDGKINSKEFARIWSRK